VPRSHWVTVSRHVLHCSLVSFVDILYTKVVPNFSFSAGPPPLLSFAFSLQSYLLLLFPQPPLFFLLRYWKEMGGITLNLPKVVPSFTFTTPPFLLSFAFLTRNGRNNPRIFRNFLPSFTYQHARPLLSLVFLERNGDGEPSIF
jgi:hypothetical protein